MKNDDEIMAIWPEIRAYAIRRYGRPVSKTPNGSYPLPNGITVSYSHGDTWVVWEPMGGPWARNRIGRFTEREMCE